MKERFLLILLLLVSSCSGRGSKSSLPSQLCPILSGSSDSLVTYDIEPILKNESFDYSSLIASIKYIPLETTVSSILPDIRSCVASNGFYCFCSDLAYSGLFIFNKEGHFVRAINKGRGPGELMELYDVSYDAENDEIVALSSPTSLSFYSPDGSFERTAPLSFWSRGFSVAENGFVFKVDSRDNHSNPDLADKDFLYTDRDLNFIGTFSHSRKDFLTRIPELTQHGNEVNCLPCFTDTVYVLSSKGLEARYHFDMGSHSVPWENVSDLDMSDFSQYCKDNKIAYPSGGILETEDYLFTHVTYGAFGIDVYIDKKGDHCYGAMFRTVSLPIESPVGVEGKSFISLIDADVISRFVQSVRDGEKSYDKTLLDEEQFKVLESVEPDDNPVLAIYKLKEF